MSITLGIIICTDLVLPSCDSAGREGGICIGNPRRLINRSGATVWELARGSASQVPNLAWRSKQNFGRIIWCVRHLSIETA